MTTTSASRNPFEIPEENFIKDYKETMRILDEATRNTIKKMRELEKSE